MRHLISAVLSATLAFCLIGIGLLVCAGLPIVTRTLSATYSPWEQSPFTQEEIVEMAVVTRDYTVGSHNSAALYEQEYRMNKAAQERTNFATSNAPDLSETDIASEETRTSLDAASDIYVLTGEAISHLDDVHEVIQIAYLAVALALIVALVGLVILWRSNRRQFVFVLLVGCLLPVAILLALALWVIIDFSGFFSWFHSLFFAEGTWTFSSKSLLITMYPTEFWIGMGAVWLGSTTLCCIVGILISFVLYNVVFQREARRDIQ